MFIDAYGLLPAPYKLIVDNLLPPIAQFREQFVAPINAAMQDVDDVSAMRVAKRKLGVLRRKMDQVLHRVTRQEVMGGDFDSYVILCRQSPLQREATVVRAIIIFECSLLTKSMQRRSKRTFSQMVCACWTQ